MPFAIRTLRVLVILGAVGVIALAGANYEFHPLSAEARADRVLVEKSARRLTLFRGGAPLKSYPVALSRAPQGTKQQEGDYRTPEGIYTIDAHKWDSAFHRATDWTAGCIAVTDKQIEEIYRAVPDGTPIEIRP